MTGQPDRTPAQWRDAAATVVTLLVQAALLRVLLYLGVSDAAPGWLPTAVIAGAVLLVACVAGSIAALATRRRGMLVAGWGAIVQAGVTVAVWSST